MQTEHLHKEAFHLMWYECEKCKCRERLWNSRDGVTPFMLNCTICSGLMQHIAWRSDEYAPNFMPAKGQRVFIDTPKDIFALYMKARVQEYWDHPDPNVRMRDRYENKDEIFKGLMTSYKKEDPFAFKI